MRATSVICRFLSLLDVALILLGMLMIVLTQAQLRARPPAPDPVESRDSLEPSAAANRAREAIDFAYFYAGTRGAERGRCYQLGPQLELLREIRTDVADDARLAFDLAPGGGRKSNRAVMLLISDEGFDSMWSRQRLAELERAWGVKVVPVYNARLD